MIDVKLLRDSPEKVRAAIARKKFKVDIDKVIELDTVRRKKITESEKARADQKLANQPMTKEVVHPSPLPPQNIQQRS